MADNTENRGKPMADRDVLEHIMDDVKYLRGRVDSQGRELTDHIIADANSQRCIQKQLSSLETVCTVSGTVEKVKMSGIEKVSFVFLSVFVATLASWVFSKF